MLRCVAKLPLPPPIDCFVPADPTDADRRQDCHSVHLSDYSNFRTPSKAGKLLDELEIDDHLLSTNSSISLPGRGCRNGVMVETPENVFACSRCCRSLSRIMASRCQARRAGI